MSDSSLNNFNNDKKANGGGAATSSGILFEQQLGAFFAAQILSGSKLDEQLGLGDASPIWLRFETEAPVDDILVATSTNGFIAIQAKTTISLSDNKNSPFYKTIEQFVRHWLTSKNGNSSLEWNRPLNPAKDRLVLALSTRASATIREDLPIALQLFSQHGCGAMNKNQKKVFDVFERCVSTAWSQVTSEPQPSELVKELSHLFIILIFDSDKVDPTIHTRLTQSLAQDSDVTAALSVLIEVCGKMMSQRGGGDLSLLRNRLMIKGIKLAAPPQYQSDINQLRLHSQEVSDALKRYEIIEGQSNQPITLTRECQTKVEQAVQSGSLLIIGEPGTGKSGVLNALARSLRERGDDVLELAVDRYSIESLEGLSRELKLEHSVIDVLDTWDGAPRGWLIIDALDATRGGKGEFVFRTLIEQVISRNGRWSVIASIRSFDLKMGIKLSNLFKGKPPIAELSDAIFPDVRHIVIPRWSDNEFKLLLEQAPILATVLKDAPERFHDLAKVPFNTRLLAELVSQNPDANLFNISSQTELLKIYWQYRVNIHGLPAKQCLKTLVNVMIANSSLKAPSLLPEADSEMIDTLCREGVLIRERNDRWVQFRHHLLFDYTAAQTAFDPEELIMGKLHFPKQQAQGLILSPALGFVLQEIWHYDNNHNQFWLAVSHLLNNKDADPIMRSSAARIAAEYPVAQNDLLWFAECVAADNLQVITTLNHICEALTVRFEDEKELPLLPWIYLVSALTHEVEKVARTLLFLLYQLNSRVTDKSLRNILGTASRVLFSYSFALNEATPVVKSTIPFIADTIDTNIDDSCTLLKQILDAKRLQLFGSEEISTLCYNIKKIGTYAPDFVVRVFEFIYNHDVTEKRETSLVNSQILSLKSNARQNYELARYSLSEYFPNFIKEYPSQATDAIVSAMNGYIARNHPLNQPSEHLSVSELNISLQADRSHIWAYNPDREYAHDGEKLIEILLQHLRTASEPDALSLAKLLSEKASLAIFWARLFLAANERNDSLIDFLWPIASQEAFITGKDTCKDAIDLVGKGILRRSEKERQILENSAFQYNFSSYMYPEEAKNSLLHRLFNAIGAENLCTQVAQDFLTSSINENTAESNERLFMPTVTVSTKKPYDYIQGLDQNEPNNLNLIITIETAEDKLGLMLKNTVTSNLSLDNIFNILNPVHEQLSLENIHPYVRITAENVIIRACAAVIKQKILPPVDAERSEELTSHFLKLLNIASHSEEPAVEKSTEEKFESSVGWGSPAPRIDAAQIILDIIPLRPDLYEQLKSDIEKMLIDPHPAVRFQASIRLLRLWNVDQDAVWHHLNERVERETNTGVLEHLVGDCIRNLLHIAPQQTFCLIQKLLGRFNEDPERRKRVRNMVSSDLTILWGVHEIKEAYSILQDWYANPTAYKDELNHVLYALREGFTLGLDNHAMPNDMEIRQRALNIAYSIIDNASTKLEEYYSHTDFTPIEQENINQCAEIIDRACLQLRFACQGEYNSDKASLEYVALNKFMKETEKHLKRIGDCGTPHTIYSFLELLKILVPVNPAKCFDLMAHALRHGTQFSFQYEAREMGQLVKMMGVFLADYKTIFEDENRRIRLIESLDIFMAAGWPAARRLLYRLPELIQ